MDYGLRIAQSRFIYVCNCVLLPFIAAAHLRLAFRTSALMNRENVRVTRKTRPDSMPSTAFEIEDMLVLVLRSFSGGRYSYLFGELVLVGTSILRTCSSSARSGRPAPCSELCMPRFALLRLVLDSLRLVLCSLRLDLHLFCFVCACCFSMCACWTRYVLVGSRFLLVATRSALFAKNRASRPATRSSFHVRDVPVSALHLAPSTAVLMVGRLS